MCANDGELVLMLEWDSSVTSDWEAVSVGDVDIDGIIEVITYLNDGGLIVYKWMNQNLHAVYQDEIGIITCGSNIGDLDNDGFLEFVAGAGISDELEIIKVYGYNSSDFEVEWEGTFLSQTSPHDIRISDVDDDGALEIVISDYDAVRVLDYNIITHNYEETWNYSSGINFWMDVGDIDGDGVEEIIVTKNGGRFYLFDYNQVVSTFDIYVVPELGLGTLPWGLESGDFDADGLDEFIIGDESGIARVFSWNMETGPLLDYQVNVTEDAYGLASGDLDGDSIPEFIVGSSEWESKDVLRPLKVVDYIENAYQETIADYVWITNAEIYDLDQDGIQEVIANSLSYVKIYSRACYLSVTSEETIEGEGWYAAGSTVQLDAGAPRGFLVRSVFKKWTGDISSGSPSVSLVMDEAKSVAAEWTTDYSQAVLVGGLAIVIFGGRGYVTVKRWLREQKEAQTASELRERILALVTGSVDAVVINDVARGLEISEDDVKRILEEAICGEVLMGQFSNDRRTFIANDVFRRIVKDKLKDERERLTQNKKG